MKLLSTLLTGAAAWLCFGACATAENNTMPNAEQPTYREYQQEQNTSYGTEKPRASFWRFDTIEQALKILPENSNYYQSLDGVWKFNWAPNPDQRPKDFYTQRDFSKWNDIKVPGSIQVQGFGAPIYANQPYLFDPYIQGEPAWPSVMHTPQNQNYYTYKVRNEVGSYARTFTIPEKWNGKEVYLNFEGVEGFFYAWVNGHYLGFHKDARNPAAFNITPYVKKGENTVCVEVYRQHDGSYLEAQDMYRFSGIIRNVSLLAADKVHVRDFFATTDLTQDFFGMRTGEGYVNPTVKKNYNDQWTVDVSADIRNLFPKHTAVEGYTLEMNVYDENGKALTPVQRNRYEAFTKRPLRLSGMEDFTVQLLGTYQSPKLWSAEIPNLYTLVLTLRDKNDKVVEHVSSQLGFRKIEILDKIFYINGQPVKLLGVNRHETDPELGHYVSRELQTKDFEIMKQGNINHVRNSHYPQDFYFYYLANIYGIYVEDEANIESHAYYYGKESISHPTEWLAAHVDRIMNMVERNKNFPCVVIWSLGNEAGPGRNFITAERVLKARDWTRPTHYERFNDKSLAVDIPSNQYGGEWYAYVARDNQTHGPYYASEYAHNMGNAAGVEDYVRAFEAGPYCIGGAIWDFVDQAMYQPIADDGKEIAYNTDWRWAQKQYKNRRLAYGGDWKDLPNSGQFVCNGIIMADRKLQPVYYEVRHAYQRIRMFYKDGQFEITNKYFFKDLSDYTFTFDYLVDGEIVESHELSVPTCAPGKTVTVPCPKVEKQNNAAVESYRVTAKLKHDTLWAKKGYPMAYDQTDVQSAQPKVYAPVGSAPKYTESKDNVTFSTKNVSLVLCKKTGALNSYKVNGVELLKEPMRVNAFRAPTNNDGFGMGKWAANGLRVLDGHVAEFELKKGAKSIAVDVTFNAKGAQVENFSDYGGNHCKINTRGPVTSNSAQTFKVNARWEIFADGSIGYHSVIIPVGKSIELPQVGYEFFLNPSLKNVEYFGCGPEDNYPDRISGTPIGLYKTTVADMFVPYMRPQAYGQHLNTYKAALTDQNGSGIMFNYLNKPFAFTANAYTPGELLETMHFADLPESTQTFVTICAAASGVGTGICGPGPFERYLIRGDRPYPLSFMIRPVINGEIPELVSLPDVSLDQTMAKFEPKFKVLQTPSQENHGSEAFVNCLDGDPSTIWHSQYGVTMGEYPYIFALDLKKAKKIKGITSLPRQDGVNGRIKGYKVELSSDGKSYETVAEGEFENNSRRQRVMFKKPVEARYIRFTATSEQGGRAYCSMAEFDIIE